MPDLDFGLSVEQVSFTYPGSPEPALNNVSLTIPAGKVTAIVGPNGAGKSTLLRLLCRFYDPQEGQVRWDGLDLREFRSDEYRRRLTALFQNPVRYQETAEFNISLSDDHGEGASESAIRALATKSGAHSCIQRLQKGYQTLLGKAFAEGADLSSGEWQQIAFARAFARDASLVLIDEPTTFMDPCSEATWFQKFRQLRGSKTCVLITHRLSVAMKADHICVLEGGRIVESGTHASLHSRNGVYFAMWAAQTSDDSAIRKEAIA